MQLFGFFSQQAEFMLFLATQYRYMKSAFHAILKCCIWQNKQTNKNEPAVLSMEAVNGHLNHSQKPFLGFVFFFLKNGDLADQK